MIIMDVVTTVLIFFVVFIVFALCLSCCKENKEGTVYGVAQANVPPYPVTDNSSMPQPTMIQPGVTVYPTTGFPSAQIFTPPIQNYPPPNPYPPPTGDGYSNPTPYPPMPFPIQSQSEPPPPSYAEAVTQPSTAQVYAKQAAYNPNF